MLHPKLEQLVAAFVERGIIPSIITNGLELDTWMDRLAELDLLYLSVSLNEPTREWYKITNGVDVGLYETPPDPDPLRAELGLGDRFLCVYVGGMGILHDVGTLVEAARHLREEAIDLLLIGQGDDRGHPRFGRPCDRAELRRTAGRSD